MNDDRFNSACATALYDVDPGTYKQYAELVQEGLLKDQAGIKGPKEATRGQKVADAAFTWYIHSMLSNVTTHVVNAVSNTVPLASRMLESTIGSGVAFAQTRNTAQFKVAMADATGIVEGGAEAFVYLARRAKYFKHGKSRQDTLSEIGVPEELMYRNKLQTEGQLTDADPVGSGDTGLKQAMQWAKVMAPGNQLANMDTFFKVISFRAEVSKRAMRKAIKDGGSAEDIARNHAKYKEETLTNMESPDAKAAIHAAEEATYTDTPATELDRLMAEKGHDMAGMRWIVPFRRTMVNIIKWGVKRSPAALLSPRTIKQITGKSGTIAQQEAIGRIGAGTALISAVYMLADDNLVGYAPRGSQERDLWERDGHKEMSITLPGLNTYISLDALGGVGLWLKAVAAWKQNASAISYEADEGAEETLMSSAMELTLGTAEVLMDEHWMTNIMDFLDAMFSATREHDEKALLIYASKVANAMNPNIIKQQITKRIDPNVKDISSPMDALIARVPYWSKNVTDKIDIWGEVMQYDNFMDPAVASSVTGQDPLSKYMRDLGMNIPEPRRTYLGVKMTPQEYQAMMIAAGKGPMGMPPLREALTKTIKSKYWGKITSDRQRGIHLKNIINEYRNNAKIQVQHDPRFDLNARVEAQQIRNQQ